MSVTNRDRASLNSPRENSLWARSKALSAAASSRVGCRGIVAAGGDGLPAAGLIDFKGVELDALTVLAGATAGRLVGGKSFTTAVGVLFPGVLEETLFAFLAGRATMLFDEEAVDFVFVAFFAGAFSAVVRLLIGAIFADLLASVRFFIDGLVADGALVRLREAGREGGRFKPFVMGSLMRSLYLQ